MFTGIIEEVGKIESISRSGNSSRLTVSGNVIFDDLKIGDSVSVSGVCLTVTEISKHTFISDATHETLNRSILASLKSGANVNLERAVKLGGRLGGHIVSGHVDGVGKISRIKKDGNSFIYTVNAGELSRQIAEKGSVALDGISLTVAKVLGYSFTVSVIPHTLGNTTLAFKKIGSPINIETDCIAKYVEKVLTGNGAKSNGITKEFLLRNGF